MFPTTHRKTHVTLIRFAQIILSHFISVVNDEPRPGEDDSLGHRASSTLSAGKRNEGVDDPG